jgi:two-component system phosphate regulon sensor histidine kinase PhoR
MDQAQPWAELAALRRRQKEQAESMQMLVHELRSPVLASRSMVAALRYVRRDDEQLEDFLTRIQNRMDQLLDLVNDIVDLSQVKAGHPLGQVIPLDLVAHTGEVCEPYLAEAAARGLAMTLELPESPVRVRMAEQAFHLVLSNLVSNAAKYTPRGSVNITLQQEGSWVVLQVVDTGIGIPQEEIPQLFTEFYRASNARRGQIPGTGLGLAGVKALVERCGGELEVESQENCGSTFTVRLPLHNPTGWTDD